MGRNTSLSRIPKRWDYSLHENALTVTVTKEIRYSATPASEQYSATSSVAGRLTGMNHTSAASFTRSIAKKEMQPISAKPVSTITMSFKAEGFFILSAAKSLGIDEERTFRAVTLSNLMAIHIHADFGPLSGLCGATIAAAAAACGLVYLQGGTLEQIGFAVNNMFGNVSGMLCDGAKADCALKISTCVFAAFQCAAMALRSESVKATDGIVETDPEETIRNFVRLGNEGSSKCDDLILEMLLQK